MRKSRKTLSLCTLARSALAHIAKISSIHQAESGFVNMSSTRKANRCSAITETQPITISNRDVLYMKVAVELMSKLVTL